MKLITTDSYFNIFPLVAELVKTGGAEISKRKLIFCEEKISLMMERAVCHALKGTFNTEVYSFGGYLLKNKNSEKILSKESSSMVIKKLIGTLSLKCLKANKTNVAPTLCQTIMQLKSAKISPSAILEASEKAVGVLKNKLFDVALVYAEYEKYLTENGFEDQSSLLSYLPDIIKNSEQIKNSDVYIVGYTSFTAQIREIISALISSARSVTAVLPYGENAFSFVNETERAVKDIAKELGEGLEIIHKPTAYLPVSKIIKDELFLPVVGKVREKTENVYYSAFTNTYAEIERVAEAIKKMVKNGYRYRDFKIIVPKDGDYVNEISKFFTLLDIPYFLDVKKIPISHPLITLILSYIDIFRKNYEREAVLSFCKNPLFCEDKDFLDRFENYLLKYNLNFLSLKKDFTYSAETEEELQKFNEFRIKIASYISSFNPRKMIEDLNAKEKIESFNQKLSSLGKEDESALGKQIYDSTIKLLGDMQRFLGEEKLSYSEYKNIFKSGIMAMEISILPHFNDAVFVGAYREAGLAVSPITFAVGLTEGVPMLSDDVALLTDADINALETLKVLVEPKIKVVNHRYREQTVLGLASFSEKLFLSYPVVDYSGTKNAKSEILDFFAKRFTIKPFEELDGYLTKLEAKRTFAIGSGRFSEGLINDFTLPSSFYACAVEDAKKILEYSKSEVKLRLSAEQKLLAREVSSPTAIESYNVCPYRYFLEKGLKVSRRETGELSPSIIGVIMHEIFCSFTKRIEEIDSENAIRDINKIFLEESEKTLSKGEYSALKEDASINAGLNSALKECKKFCIKTYNWSLGSKFKTASDDVEVKFGKGRKYPEIELLNGKVKLSGTIDRVDKFGDYCRIIDYKTGTASDDDKNLFAGSKLQLYLYALAVNDKKVAGLYYLPVKDKYLARDEKEESLTIGKTLDDEELIFAGDNSLTETNSEGKFIPVKRNGDSRKNVISEKGLQAEIEYAKKISELALTNMEEGFIAPTPLDGACEYCEFKSTCGKRDGDTRKIRKVQTETFEKAILED